MSELTFAKKIEKELSSKKAEEIETLDLCGCTGESFEGLTDKFVNLKGIVANGCGLKSTEGLPVLKNLLKLDLSNNQITDLKAVAALPSLTVLELVNNNISDPAVLEPLYNHPKLECLNIEGNAIKKHEGYLDELFANLPHVVAIDGSHNPNDSTFAENGDDYDDEEYDSDHSGSESEEEVGLEALQRSGDLEDDEDEYNPDGEDEEEEDFEEEDDEDEEEGQNGKSDEKGAIKRKAETANGDVAESKHARVSETNGADSE
ncbi:Acidic leucine-rich nuclear phosphoprotein 32 member B [Cichlidogyrus casuarinus]|uniref:Acidic leucine-rich nuclear phosphoprotein 32 member B n=1 Tax=Cichlidogyrus casuarinus TaxID=1844966 RepID=A0ABD2QEP7_9PLAT